MEEAHELYLITGKNISDSQESQLFGKPCFKINGKAFICFFENCLVAKLSGDVHSDALSLDGSGLFDPSKKHRPMKEWVQVPFDYQNKWAFFARQAFDYVKGD